MKINEIVEKIGVIGVKEDFPPKQSANESFVGIPRIAIL
jgi:hypothetical protein